MTDFEKLGVFYLGRRFDPEMKTTTEEPVLYDAKDLTTHAVCVGMTGSGKTGLGIGLIEEAAFPYNVGVARMAGVANGNYVYDVSNYVNETTGVVNNPSLVRKDAVGESRWALQVGFRFEF